jgi:hypothetical protein
MSVMYPNEEDGYDENFFSTTSSRKKTEKQPKNGQKVVKAGSSGRG